MTKNKLPTVEAHFDKIIGGGQALATLPDGKKLFAWGALPDEVADVQLTKKKSHYLEGFTTSIQKVSKDRIEPKDPDSYLSTSPWQIMDFNAEQRYKAALIEEAFELHDIVLPDPITVYSDNNQFGYRNKIEFSFWFDTNTETLSLAFFRRGSHGKVAVSSTSLAADVINQKAQEIVAVLNRLHIIGRDLKTLLIRSNQAGETAWQLYVKDESFDAEAFMAELPQETRGEVIYSNPKSPASVITKRLTDSVLPLSDTIMDVPFHYATEGFFQINLPVYEQALKDMKQWVPEGAQLVDLYSGVGSIGLTIGGPNVTLVEVNEHAVREMERNITELGIAATPVLAASEKALDYITGDKTIIVDPPRAGLHQDVIDRLLEEKPARIIYLSCNPVTQARDIGLLGETYGIKAHQGYNFFPRTPHIENLVVLDLKP